MLKLSDFSITISFEDGGSVELGGGGEFFVISDDDSKSVQLNEDKLFLIKQVLEAQDEASEE